MARPRCTRAGSLFRTALAIGICLHVSEPPHAAGSEFSIDNDWFRAWPPGGVTYSFPSPINQGGRRLGDIDTLHLHATYIQPVPVGDSLNWLAGLDWQRFQASVPAGSPVPHTLQSAAAVLGFDWRFRQRWRARLEVLPGIYSDFHDFSGDDINAPVSAEISWSIRPNLLVGGQLSVNARRDAPLLGGAGIRWRFADDWLLSLWFPRPRLEFNATEHVTFFGGAAFAAGTYVVSDNFGSRRERPDLDGQAVDFQEVRIGGGLRYTVGEKLGFEFAGGWTVDRRYHFHSRHLLLNGDGAPYVQLSFGAMF